MKRETINEIDGISEEYDDGKEFLTAVWEAINSGRTFYCRPVICKDDTKRFVIQYDGVHGNDRKISTIIKGKKTVEELRKEIQELQMNTDKQVDVYDELCRRYNIIHEEASQMIRLTGCSVPKFYSTLAKWKASGEFDDYIAGRPIDIRQRYLKKMQEMIEKKKFKTVWPTCTYGQTFETYEKIVYLIIEKLMYLDDVNEIAKELNINSAIISNIIQEQNLKIFNKKIVNTNTLI